ncbi:hypothetical protein VNO80_00006 [Phaseolus coccineus]|uniref:Peptide chain release factor domain-containing protein n=1 Tax=Phaseolus coccineus TaxID=3886 RepID=A0AAN9P390_PHACN
MPPSSMILLVLVSLPTITIRIASTQRRGEREENRLNCSHVSSSWATPSRPRRLFDEAANLIKELNKSLDRYELTQLLSGPYDKEGAVISITAGAGGTDAQDWADMLLRMYVRWGEKQRYKTRVIEKSPGEEAGIKSATVEVEVRYAYGYLSGEKGTHRIVRQSPFNAKGLRQTSFSGVEVMPLLPEESMDVEIPEEDLEIKERSQLANKIRALSRLKAKLLVIAEEQRASEIKQIRGDAVKAEWGATNTELCIPSVQTS